MRVLLVEDDAATTQSIQLMLKSESFNVYTTDLGEEGVDLGRLYDYDIILLDLDLPDMSGFEVLRSLRLSKVKTPILILSGMTSIEHIEAFAEAYQQDYVNNYPGSSYVVMNDLPKLARLKKDFPSLCRAN